MKVEFYVQMNIVGTTRTEIIEVDDNTSEETLDEILVEWINNHIDCGWKRIDEEC